MSIDPLKFNERELQKALLMSSIYTKHLTNFLINFLMLFYAISRA